MKFGGSRKDKGRWQLTNANKQLNLNYASEKYSRKKKKKT